MPPPKKKGPVARLSIVSNNNGKLVVSTDGTGGRQNVSVIWWDLSWGDGSLDSGSSLPPSQLTHTYTSSGTYNVTLRVIDRNGLIAEARMSIIMMISPTPPTPPEEGGGSDELTWTEAQRYAHYCEGGYTGPGTVRTVAAFTDEGIQAQIDAASDGDIVCMPAGTYTVDASIGITDKNIFMLGEGVGATYVDHTNAAVGNTFAFYISQPTKGDFRISGMTMTGVPQLAFFNISSPAFNGIVGEDGVGAYGQRWRIDHMDIDLEVGTHGLIVYGANYGLVDHWTGTIPAVVLVLLAQYVDADFLTPFPVAGDLIATQPLDLGTDKFVVMEDSTMTFTWDGGNAVWFDSSAGGGRVVLRHNNMTGALIYNHWTRGVEYAAQVMEIYSNVLTGTDASGSANGWDSYVGQIEAGTGVVYNNQINGYDENAPSDPYFWLNDRRAGPNSAITSLTRSGSTATLTLPSDHPFQIASSGHVIEIVGADQSEYEGLQTVTNVPSQTTLEFTVAGSPATPATGSITVYLEGPVGDCNGTHAWDGNIEANGWPCLGQIGRAPGKSIAQIMAGDKQPSYSFKFWNNGPEADCLTGGAGCTDNVVVYNGGVNDYIKDTAHTNGDKDYELLGNTPAAGYTPLAYPHPKQSELWNS
jgi:PKD repeat protein